MSIDDVVGDVFWILSRLQHWTSALLKRFAFVRILGKCFMVGGGIFVWRKQVDLNAAGVKQLSETAKSGKMSRIIAKIDLTESGASLQGRRTWLFMASLKIENFTLKIAPPAVHLITFLRHTTGNDSENVTLCRRGKSFWILIDVKVRIIDARFSFLFRVFYNFSIVERYKESSWL